MKIRKLKLGKEIVANLSESESSQIKGGTDTFNMYCVSVSCGSCGCTIPSNGTCMCGGNGDSGDYGGNCGRTYDWC